MICCFSILFLRIIVPWYCLRFGLPQRMMSLKDVSFILGSLALQRKSNHLFFSGEPLKQGFGGNSHSHILTSAQKLCDSWFLIILCMEDGCSEAISSIQLWPWAFPTSFFGRLTVMSLWLQQSVGLWVPEKSNHWTRLRSVYQDLVVELMADVEIRPQDDCFTRF